MGKSWDTGETAFSVDFWRGVFRVLVPGGHVVAFGGTRAFHRLTCAIEDAGFEVRDMLLELAALDPIVGDFVGSLSDAQLSAFLRVADLLGMEGVLAWVYGSGFPKTHDVADRVARGSGADNAAGQFEGWGTALKPAWEPICLARKPLAGTVAANVRSYGAGGLNVDGCRVGDDVRYAAYTSLGGLLKQLGTFGRGRAESVTPARRYVGRFPANVVLDGSAEVAGAFPHTASGKPGFVRKGRNDGAAYGAESRAPGTPLTGFGDAGSASRFFYSAKADADDRAGSKHPTVKPVDLMRWLCRLVTPPGGVVLDPFAGSGTTGEAAWREGFDAVLVEREPEYQADIRRRLALCTAGPQTRRRESLKARGEVADAGPLFGGEAAE